MAFDFSGKRVVVAGGSRGIGRAIALGFASAGAAVSVCARGADGLQAVAQELAVFGHAVHTAPCDLADAAAVAAYVADAAATLGGIDVLVNNASGFGMVDSEEAWHAALQVDVMAMVRASRAALPALLAQPGSSIVNISSISGLRPSTRAPAYAAVKALMFNYTSSQAAMHAAQGLRVNCVAPGSIEFPGGIWERRRLAQDPLYAQTLSGLPMGRMGTAEEVAEVVMFLASPHARWVTGQVLAVDGGQLLGA